MVCKLCNRDFKDITNTHLKIHGLSRSEYMLIDHDFAVALKKRMSVIAKGKQDIKKGKTYEDIVGKEKADAWKAKIGKASREREYAPFSQEHCDNIAKAKKGKPSNSSAKFKKNDPRITGSNNPNWMGGVSKDIYPKGFDNNLKEAIRQRDYYRCQLCGCPELENTRKLPVHHIDYDKHNGNPDNLIALCDRCHTKTNSNRDYWTEYFKNSFKRIDNCQLSLRGGSSVINKVTKLWIG